jgi:hypothetical protein
MSVWLAKKVLILAVSPGCASATPWSMTKYIFFNASEGRDLKKLDKVILPVSNSDEVK